jgi:hypothetical protein
MECRRGEMVLLPRSGHAFGEGGCRGRAGVVMRVSEVCGLHGEGLGGRGTCWWVLARQKAVNNMVVNARDAPRQGCGPMQATAGSGELLRSRRSQAVQPTSLTLEPGTRATSPHGFSFAARGDFQDTYTHRTNSPHAHSHSNPVLCPLL